MNCSQCSHPLPPNTKFCKHCGTRQETEPAAFTLEKSCSQCGAACKPDARFCTQCGLTFTHTSATSAAASSAHASADKLSPAQPAAAESKVPPSIEPVDSVATPQARRPEHREAPAFQPVNASAPALPAEPTASSNGWIKWALLAMVIVAIIAGVQMAGSMKSMAVSGKNSSASPAADKDSVSAEDKARADALVGPQSGTASAASTSPAQPDSSTPASQEQTESLNQANTSAASTALAIEDAANASNTAAVPAPASSTAQTAAPAPVKAARPVPPRVEPPARNAGPSLDDLLD